MFAALLGVVSVLGFNHVSWKTLDDILRGWGWESGTGGTCCFEKVITTSVSFGYMAFVSFRRFCLSP